MNIEKLSDVAKVYNYYVEYHMSLREISKEMCIGHMTAKRYLDSLKYINDVMYVNYLNEKKRRLKR